MIRLSNLPLRCVAVSIAGLLLNAMLLCVPLVLRGGLDQLWHDPAVAAILLLATALVISELSAAGTRRRTSVRPAEADRWPLRLAACTGASLLALFWLALFEHVGRTTSPVVAISGGLLMALGICLRCVAIRALGPHFVSEVVVRSDQTLVRCGIYRFLRHPSEAGLLAISLGACLLLGSPMAATVWATIFLPLALVRMVLEDRQLRLAFGRDFETYCRTKRIVPLVF